ncbi:MAG: hypothetical protein SFV51_11845 [Bryobacteraceae bacterium]|nr:hypothetical protein [Bryobacteraceae bacterium]
MATKKKAPDSGKTARRVARKVVGIVRATRVEVPKPERKAKHKKQAEETE